MHKTRPLFKILRKSNASSAKSMGGWWGGGRKETEGVGGGTQAETKKFH